MTLWKHLKDDIRGYGDMVKQKLAEGWQGSFMTFMFNPLPGGIRQMNNQMQKQIENTYASFITRLHRRPHSGVTHPILISCPDWQVRKHKRKSKFEVTINDGLHNHGILLVPPGSSRLKVSIQQHFKDNESYYLRDQILKRIDVEPITHNVDHLTDYALKGLKANRLPGHETLLILPKTDLEISVRPYLIKPNAE
jgi:hypothetical protein